ncbi:hypothetical protein [Limobrevibacterium gyesilva]|uniref:Lipoprotein n=1 Tax=Limobrevibacterium gyesilva TaxID=2991712 RepID=A0AA41YPZ1_9PROT|nr:hypothetical protein [Limobrevibacterium gyesilva]MCW3476576.1 hypothetical protein [Limobrevibacterium gyesilva]
MPELRAVLLGACVVVLAGCQNYNDIAMKIGAPPKEAVDLRSFEVRRYDRVSDATLLAAATATLQDLGYIVTESAPTVGVVVASKQRDAVETGQVVGQVVLTVALAALGTINNPTWDQTQEIHVTLVAAPVGPSTARDVRVSFDRYITNNHGQLWKTELVMDQQIYAEFFDRLGTALKLEQDG